MKKHGSEWKLAENMRLLKRAAQSLCPSDVALQIRMGAPDVRKNYTRVRMEGVDALDIGTLVKRFPECLFYVRDCRKENEVGTSAAIDAYIPCGRRVSEQVLSASSKAIALLAVAVFSLALWTRVASSSQQ